MVTAGKFLMEQLGELNSIEWKKLASATRCSRCRGLMVIEPCFDFLAWRCVQCGDMIDPVILQNRQRLAMN
jgi:PHP family Zn ribbon phosphoesterase